jgi:aspartate/tyrosine/aromatic aminotransferase
LRYTVRMSFGYCEPAPEDPIFAVSARAAQARNDGLDPIDATIGVITDSGDPARPTLLPCVRQAADALCASFHEHASFPYSPLLGVTAYRDAVRRLVFDDGVMVASVAATGGTAAVALNLHLAKIMGIKRVILPVPTWPNHRQLLEGSALSYTEVAGTSFCPPAPERVLDCVRRQSDPVLFLLQANAHNPTGRQWSVQEWQSFASGIAGSAHIVLLDCAYQGLSEGVEEDRAPIRVLQEAGVNVLVAWSASKNHSIYGLRTGLACAVVSSAEEQWQLEQWYRILTRRMNSTAPTFGQLIVAKVQEEYADEWRTQVSDVRTETDRKRRMVQDAFPEWADHVQGTGLFTVLPLDRAAVERLRDRNVFLTDDGRVNLGGIPLCRMDAFIDAVRGVAEGRVRECVFP